MDHNQTLTTLLEKTGISDQETSDSMTARSTSNEKAGLTRAKVPSLQDLARLKALEGMLDPDFNASEFHSFPFRLQQLLFRGLLVRLRQIEQSHADLKERLPPADKQLYTPAARDPIENAEEKGENDGHRLYDPIEKTLHQKRWSYAAREYPQGIGRHCHWASQHLGPRYVLATQRLSFDRSTSTFQVIYPPPPMGRGEKHLYLHQTISSQLLQYRVTAFFGMMPRLWDDGDASC